MTDNTPLPMTIIIPAYNEERVIGSVLSDIQALGLAAEIIVVDDGSSDDTAAIAESLAGVRVLRHAYNIGNGAAVKTGIRAAQGDVIVFMDGDGQHQPTDIERLLAPIVDGHYDMVVGARTAESESELHRDLANKLYNMVASYLVGREVKDLTSGFRAIRAPIAKSIVNFLPNGFSYPSTSTIAVFRLGYTVHYEPIQARARVGRSKIRLLRDGVGFLLTLARIGTLFAPLKLFIPVSGVLFGVGGAYVAAILIMQQRFSNMGGLLVLAGIMLFMLGLISEQIALLRLSQAVETVTPPHASHRAQ